MHHMDATQANIRASIHVPIQLAHVALLVQAPYFSLIFIRFVSPRLRATPVTDQRCP